MPDTTNNFLWRANQESLDDSFISLCISWPITNYVLGVLFCVVFVSFCLLIVFCVKIAKLAWKTFLRRRGWRKEFFASSLSLFRSFPQSLTTATSLALLCKWVKDIENLITVTDLNVCNITAKRNLRFTSHFCTRQSKSRRRSRYFAIG